jgi:hypothetical protein
MVLIHVSEVNNRLRYIFDLIFKDILKIEYTFSSTTEEFMASNLPKFSYGKSSLGNFLHINSDTLLFEKDVHKQHIEFKQWNNLPIFFHQDNANIPFDIFAASFYLVTRYEEYLPHGRDSHNRFKSEEGSAFKGGFLDRPLVNLWAIELKALLQKKFPQLQFPYPVFSFTPTIDIDNAYAYKYKGWFRITTSLLQRLFKLEFSKFMNRLRVHMGTKRDPYDSYEKQNQVHKSYNIHPLYFILIGDYGRFDKNLAYNNKYFIELIKSLGQKASIGLHPSYASNRSDGQLTKEKERLEHILEKKVERSRQHYIRMHLPYTYRNLVKLGIREDYSMGYPSKVGFRASVCTPFYFFDIEENQQTALKVFPFVAMDSTFKYYLKCRSKEVIPFLKPIVDEIKKVGGDFVFIFHNESIGNERNWKNWGDLYEKVIKLALSNN